MDTEKDGNGSPKLEVMTRRKLLRGMAVTAGVLAAGAAAGIGPIGIAEAGKCPGTTPKAAVAYQDHPNGAKHCATCAFFIAPGCCKVVAGPVVASGYCKAFSPKMA